MSQPTITGNTPDIIVTAGDVLVGDPGDQVDLGFVSKISINIKHLTTEVKTDQAGKMDVDDRHVGDMIDVEMELDELTAPRLKQAYPFGALIGSGSTYRIAWGRNIGSSFYAVAKQIVIRPTIDDVNYTARNFVFYKASPIGDSKISYTPEGKAVIKTKFKVYPDFQKPNNEYLGYFGDINSGTFVPASHGSVTPGGGNVGTGTLGTIVVNDTFTLTETWTATCIAASGSTALFSVVGSETGARGVATTGATFHSNSITTADSEVSFLISQGGTNFAVGDTFSFDTTQANFT